MNRALLLLLLTAASAAWADPAPTVRHYARAGCGDCAALTSAVRALGTRWKGRVAAVIAKRPPAARHGHDVELLLRPTRDPAEARITLRWTDLFGRPTPAADGRVQVGVGDATYGVPGGLHGQRLARHGAWKLVAARLQALRKAYRGASPFGRPLVLDADRQVPRAHLLQALQVLADALDAEVRAWPVRGGALAIPPRARVELPEPAEAPEPPTGAEPDPEPRALPGRAARLGVAWLLRHQEPNGWWSVRGWKQRCKGPGCQAAPRDAGDGRYDVGVTALALQALASAGKRGAPLTRGVRWLIAQQRPDGSIGFRRAHGESIYNHAIAAAALCRLAKGARQRAAAKRAVDWVVRAQNPGLGWHYGVRSGRNDTSTTAWMVRALAAARDAKLPVPAGAWGGARAWIQRATSARGAVGYQTPGGGSAYLPANDGKYDEVPSMTAAGVRALLLTGERPANLRAGQRLLLASLPAWAKGQPRRCNFYYWLWGSEACFELGAPAWRAWKASLEKALLPMQVRQGCGRGSWPPTGEWCLAGGRVYGTAANVLSLTTARRLKR